MANIETCIAVIVPYYQDSRGPLEEALASIYEQTFPATCRLDVLIIDDSSPSPATSALSRPPPHHVNVCVIVQPNGGPAAARNTGLNACGTADYIAFLDSDDRWAPDHLARALATLGNSDGFYFSDHGLGTLSSHATRFQEICAEQQSPEFMSCGLPTDIVAREPANPTVEPIAPEGSFAFRGREGLTALLRVFSPHISTTVIDAKSLGHIRFCTDLKNAGEDYLYFLTLASAAGKVCFSRHVGAIRGKGVNIYSGRTIWSNPKSLHITMDNYCCLLIAASTLDLSSFQRKIIKRRISFRRLELVARFASQIKRDKRLRLSLFKLMMNVEPTFAPLFPIFLFVLLYRKIRNRPIVDRLRLHELP